MRRLTPRSWRLDLPGERSLRRVLGPLADRNCRGLAAESAARPARADARDRERDREVRAVRLARETPLGQEPVPSARLAYHGAAVTGDIGVGIGIRTGGPEAQHRGS